MENNKLNRKFVERLMAGALTNQEKECIRCVLDPVYFYKNYITVNGMKPFIRKEDEKFLKKMYGLYFYSEGFDFFRNVCKHMVVTNEYIYRNSDKSFVEEKKNEYLKQWKSDISEAEFNVLYTNKNET